MIQRTLAAILSPKKCKFSASRTETFTGIETMMELENKSTKFAWPFVEFRFIELHFLHMQAVQD